MRNVASDGFNGNVDNVQRATFCVRCTLPRGDVPRAIVFRATCLANLRVAGNRVTWPKMKGGENRNNAELPIIDRRFVHGLITEIGRFLAHPNDNMMDQFSILET